MICKERNDSTNNAIIYLIFENEGRKGRFEGKSRLAIDWGTIWISFVARIRRGNSGLSEISDQRNS